MKEKTRVGILGALALVCLLLGASSLLAEPVTFEWINPDGFEDDFLGELIFDRFEVGCGAVPGERADDVRTWIDDQMTTRTEDFVFGDWYCALRVSCMSTTISDCSFSDWSNELFFQLRRPVRPAAPTGLTVVVN